MRLSIEEIAVSVWPLRRRGEAPFRLQGSPTNEVTSSDTSCSAVAAITCRISPSRFSRRAS